MLPRATCAEAFVLPADPPSGLVKAFYSCHLLAATQILPGWETEAEAFASLMLSDDKSSKT